PAVGYWAQHNAFKAALASGETSHGTAKTVEAMEAVVRNTFVQGTLSIIFVVLSLIVIATAVMVTIRSVKAGGGTSLEDPALPSRIFAPASIVPTPAEKVLMKEWAESGKQSARSGH
ncbi:MAG: carbon starvation CstA family protein, partial [Specibacter sp.]